MKKLLVVIVGVVFMSSCDLGEDCNTECVPGAPELVVQITPQEALDSAYLQYDQWKIYDGVEEMAIRLNNDPNFQANGALFMDILVNDSSAIVYGGGVTWSHRSVEQPMMVIDYGNDVKDTFNISLEAIIGECCSAYNVSGLTIDNQELDRDSVRYFFQYLLEE
tara:strand:- start:6 stop:497 length:492 start_codon:yes stop_codon:yes gene_type:complete